MAFFGHNGVLSNFWHNSVEPYSTELWNQITGKSNRDFAQQQTDENFERQKWLIQNQPKMEADARRAAGYSMSFSGSNPGSTVTPSMAAPANVGFGLGDVSSIFNTIFSNVLGFKKVDSEIKNLEADTDLKNSNSRLSLAKIAEVKSIINVNNKTARNLTALYDNIVAENAVIHSKDLMQIAQANLFNNQATTELWKKRDYESQIEKRTKEGKEIDFRLNHVLPATVNKILSDMEVNAATRDNINAKTQQIFQDILMNRPNVAFCVQNFQSILKTLGAQNTQKYMTALQSAMADYIDVSKMKNHPAFNLNTGNKLNDAAGNIYMWMMSLVQGISQDLTSGIGAGLGIKGMLK